MNNNFYQYIDETYDDSPTVEEEVIEETIEDLTKYATSSNGLKYIPLDIDIAFKLRLYSLDNTNEPSFEDYLFSASLDEAYEFMNKFNTNQIGRTPYRIIGVPEEVITKEYSSINMHRNIWRNELEYVYYNDRKPAKII